MKFDISKKVPLDLLAGYTINLELHDRSVKVVTISRDSGPVCRIAEQYGSLVFLLPSKPEMEKKFHLTGTYLGLTPVSQVFDTHEDAAARMREFAREAGFPEDDKLGLKIEPIDVLAE
jgi:hypothetical protein